MLATIENTNVIHEENGYRYMATCHVLYHQRPTATLPFVEVRQWTTLDGGAAELVAEWGFVRRGELHTQATVLPFHWDVERALLWIDEQMLAAALPA